MDITVNLKIKVIKKTYKQLIKKLRKSKII